MYRSSFSIKPQAGFTIVELMIAMVLGLFLAAGLITVFISSKQAYQFQSGLATMQAGGRTALDILSQDLAMAGYEVDDAFITAQTAEGGADNDRVGVQYLSDTDCLGDATDGTARNAYFVDGTNLRCSSLTDLGAVNNTQTIVEGVESLQLLYGIDDDTDDVRSATRYVTADHVADWTQVISVRIGLLVNSVSNVSSETDQSEYQILNQVELLPAEDNLRRRPYISTIVVRNNRG